MKPPEPTLWRQVAALRELLQEGGALLGEVLLFTRTAEESLAAFDREKTALEQEREGLLASRASLEAALTEATEHERDLGAELAQLREQVARLEESREAQANRQDSGLLSLRKALLEAEERGRALERELLCLRQATLPVDRVEEPAPLSRSQIDSLQKELERTRAILEGERTRRNRAIALIHPSAGQEVPA